MRKHKFENDKIVKILEKKAPLIEEGRNLSKQMDDLNKDLHKIGLKVQKLKDKTAHLMEKESITLGEFEYIASIDTKDGQVVLEIVDAIEEYKAAYRKKVAEQAES